MRGWLKMHKERLNKLRQEMTKRGVDAFFVMSIPSIHYVVIPNIFYLTGFTGSTAGLVVTLDDSYILIDPRYTTQAKEECKSTKVIEYFAKPKAVAAAELINELKPRTVGYEPDNLNVSSFNALRTDVDSSTRFKGLKGTVEKLRRVKDSQEIELIRKAAEIIDHTYYSVIKEPLIGLTEKQVAYIIDTSMRHFGADKESFDTVAASGPNSACPHATPTDATICPSQFLKMDYGARLNYYCSDITRTISIGPPSDKQKEIYDIVLEAQIRAIEAIKPGKTGCEIDAVARDYITSKGYGDNFGHGLGHALGIEVHDGPAFSKLSDIVLEPGMVATVEPGIYIEGWGGVRIEDDVLVTEDGVEILTKATKELISI